MKVITISRDYGSGGHSIGTRVADELGIEFYDKDIIKNTARAMGLAPEEVKDMEEQRTVGDSILRVISPVSFDYKNDIFNTEREVVAQIASKKPCVILGRCAGEILREAGIDCLKVYLFADAQHCSKRVSEILNTDDPNVIAKAIKKKNSLRNAYFTYYTGKHMKDSKNFDISLDTGTLGYDACVRIICEAAQS